MNISAFAYAPSLPRKIAFGNKGLAPSNEQPVAISVQAAPPAESSPEVLAALGKFFDRGFAGLDKKAVGHSIDTNPQGFGRLLNTLHSAAWSAMKGHPEAQEKMESTMFALRLAVMNKGQKSPVIFQPAGVWDKFYELLKERPIVKSAYSNALKALLSAQPA